MLLRPISKRRYSLKVDLRLGLDVIRFGRHFDLDDDWELMTKFDSSCALDDVRSEQDAPR